MNVLRISFSIVAVLLSACAGSSSPGSDVAEHAGAAAHTVTVPPGTMEFIDGSAAKHVVFELVNTGEVTDRYELELSIDAGARALGVIPAMNKLSVPLSPGQATTIPVEIRQTPTLGAFDVAHPVRLVAVSTESGIREEASVTVTIVDH